MAPLKGSRLPCARPARKVKRIHGPEGNRGGGRDERSTWDPSPRGLLRLAAAAKRLDASRSTLYRLRDRGLLPFVYLTVDTPRLRESDVARLVKHGAGSEGLLMAGRRAGSIALDLIVDVAERLTAAGVRPGQLPDLDEAYTQVWPLAKRLAPMLESKSHASAGVILKCCQPSDGVPAAAAVPLT
jgi:hypothetical protein